jgi:repressor LexA
MAGKKKTTVDVESIQDRLKEVFESLNITIYQAAKDLGENSSKFYNILSGRAKPSYDTILNLLAQYPQVRADFLLRGMRPVLNLEPEPNGKFVAEDNLEYIEVPFVPIRFHASFVETHTEGIRPESLDRYAVHRSVVAGHKNAVIIEISGNSMTPQLIHGAKVLAVPVEDGNWEYQSGGVFAVVYRDFFVVKRIKDNELMTRKYLTLYSDNPNGGTVTVAAPDIRGIWRVVSIVESPVE